MNFSSDNGAPAHPKVIEAIAQANDGFAPSYGTDAAMDRVRAMLREVFEAPEAAVYLVATGTTANALSLACHTQPWQTIYTHQEAHVEADECGAPEFYTGGAKLSLLPGEHGRIAPDTLAAAMARTPQGFVHASQRGPVSISNSTECGAVYDPDHIAALADIAHKHGTALHMDGARFANALISAGCTAAEMTWKAGVDVLSFGGTKNGLLGVEAVILFDPARAWEFELRRKRAGHLFSKHRYLSAQMEAYLADGLWLDLATRANSAAQRLSQGILNHPGGAPMHPTEANSVFTYLPRAAHKSAMQAGANYYLWPFDQSVDGPDGEPLSARLMCSWCTTDEEIDRFLQAINP